MRLTRRWFLTALPALAAGLATLRLPRRALVTRPAIVPPGDVLWWLGRTDWVLFVPEPEGATVPPFFRPMGLIDVGITYGTDGARYRQYVQGPDWSPAFAQKPFGGAR